MKIKLLQIQILLLMFKKSVHKQLKILSPMVILGRLVLNIRNPQMIRMQPETNKLWAAFKMQFQHQIIHHHSKTINHLTST